MNHKELCDNQNHQKVEYPKPDETVSFKNPERSTKVPFVVYGDLECTLKNVKPGLTMYQGDEATKVYKESCTTKYQEHIPSGFCYYVKCFDDELYPPKLVIYTKTTPNDDVTQKLVDYLEADAKDIYDRFLTRNEPMIMTEEVEVNHLNATRCYACKGRFTEDNYKVRVHCHMTGTYRGAAHTKCNLRMKTPKFIPVLFHNLEGYDSHLFIKNLGVKKGNIRCIPRNEKRYILFSKVINMSHADKKGKPETVELRFLDSLKFTLSSLDKLVKNLGDDEFDNLVRHASACGYTNKQTKLLKQKGVYPYEYMDSFKRMTETELPPKEKFYSSLNDTNITNEDYNHAKNVWGQFKMGSLREYHDLYLKTDVLLLADVMEKYRTVCTTNYGLDPLHYYTAPGLAWDASLKMTGVKLDLLTDSNMYLMVESGIRGGVSTITHRHVKANNKYMSSYDPELDSTFITYLDANNLYGWAISQPLPTSNFSWMDEYELDNWRELVKDPDVGCILEVDLEYPNDLHDQHSDYPLAPEKVEVNGVKKLIPNLNNKTKYVVHYMNLKQYTEMGMKLTKVHRGVKFNQKPWLAEYINLNTQLRTRGSTEFEKDFYKLMNNSVFGRTMENVRNRVDIRLVTTKDGLAKLVKKPNYKCFTPFTNNMMAVHMHKTTVYLNKPIYLGMSILDLSKSHMYNFHYGYVRPKYGDNARLLFTDTDSLCYSVKTDNFYNDVKNNVHSEFDTSNYLKDHESVQQCGFPISVNKKVLGMFKDEVGGQQITEFVGLRSKLYAFTVENGDENKKCKGVKKGVVKNELKLKDYRDCLYSGKNVYRGMNTFRSRGHTVYTERIVKTALSSTDDKRVIMSDGISTKAYGHWRIIEKMKLELPDTLTVPKPNTPSSLAHKALK